MVHPTSVPVGHPALAAGCGYQSQIQTNGAAVAEVLAEYLTGVVLDSNPARQAAQRAFLAELLAVMPVEDYTPTVAEHHAALLAHGRRTGRPRGAHDLIIAATARATGRLLVTTDGQAGFAELPDVQVRVLTA